MLIRKFHLAYMTDPEILYVWVSVGPGPVMRGCTARRAQIWFGSIRDWHLPCILSYRIVYRTRRWRCTLRLAHHPQKWKFIKSAFCTAFRPLLSATRARASDDPLVTCDRRPDQAHSERPRLGRFNSIQYGVVLNKLCRGAASWHTLTCICPSPIPRYRPASDGFVEFV